MGVVFVTKYSGWVWICNKKPYGWGSQTPSDGVVYAITPYYFSRSHVSIDGHRVTLLISIWAGQIKKHILYLCFTTNMYNLLKAKGLSLYIYRCTQLYIFVTKQT
jgi:hypothetical protein